MDFPLITIVMTTYFPETKEGTIRRVAARTTLKSWYKYLRYSGLIDLIIVHDGYDNGGITDNTARFHNEAMNIWVNPSVPNQITTFYHKRNGIGESLNRGFYESFKKNSRIVLYAVDDWALTEQLDLNPWVQLLLECEDVGMVRLGPPHPNIRGTAEMFTENWQGWGLRLDRYSYAYAQRPALYHKRFIDSYGWFKEGVSAIECEREYAEHFVKAAGPDIVLALPHPWKHIDTVSMSDIKPE